MNGSAPPPVALSQVRGPPEPALHDLTISGALAFAARTWGSAQAIVSLEDDARLTFAQLYEKSGNLADSLFERGLRKGDRIGIWSPNNIGWALVQFAAARAGFIFVTFKPAYRSADLHYPLKNLRLSPLFLPTFHTTTHSL